MRIGVPSNSVNCFEGVFGLLLSPGGIGAMRVPRPAAGIMTTTFIRAVSIRARRVRVQMCSVQRPVSQACCCYGKYSRPSTVTYGPFPLATCEIRPCDPTNFLHSGLASAVNPGRPGYRQLADSKKDIKACRENSDWQRTCTSMEAGLPNVASGASSL
jgi:hypothetical protein